VNEDELVAWYEDIEGRAEAAKQTRDIKAKATDEIAEANGVRARDQGIHTTRRNNARLS
jgi:hypothetical protein